MILRFSLRVAYAMLLVIASDTLELFKDGGAREEGFESAFNNYAGPLNYVNIIWLFFAAAVVGALMLKYVRKLKRSNFNAPIIILIFYAGISCIWADYPYPALRTTLLIAIAFLIIFLSVRIFSIENVLLDTSRILTAMLIGSLFAVFLLPSYGISVSVNHEGSWQGIFNHKNQLGNICATAFVVFLAQHRLAPKSFDIFKFCLALILATGSQSYTALAAIGIAICLYFIYKKCRQESVRFKLRYAVLVGFLIISISAVLISLGNFSAQFLDKDITFSNRNVIWGYMLGQTIESPFFGHGIDQLVASLSTNSSDFFYHVGFVVASSHNGFIELGFALGGLGLAMYAWVAVSAIKSYSKNFTFVMVYIISFLAINTFESKMFGFNIFFLIFLLFIEAGFVSKQPSYLWKRTSRSYVGGAGTYLAGTSNAIYERG